MRTEPRRFSSVSESVLRGRFSLPYGLNLASPTPCIPPISGFAFYLFFSHVLSHVMTHIGLYTGPGVSMYISECFFSWNRRLEDIHNQVR
jgi:hypothetical protein